MKLKDLEAELEATCKKISKQLLMVGKSIQSIDPTLYDKEEVLEQVIAMWRVEFDTIAEPEENDNGPAMGAEAQAAFERMTAHKEQDNECT